MINLYDILKSANGQLFGEPAANLFTDFCLDAQHVGENQIFVALRTDRGDTHQYIPEAIENGVAGVLCVEPPVCDTTDVSVLMVDETVEALLKWSRFTLDKLDVKTIAVLGSSGKSSTVDAINHVISSKFNSIAGELDISGKLAIPLSLPALTANHDYVTLKLDTSIPGELDAMMEIVHPEIVTVLDIDCVHPSAFDSCDDYTSEFANVLKTLDEHDFIVINYDNDRTRELTNELEEPTIKTVGIDRFGADILAFNVKVGVERIGFDLRVGDDRYVARWSPILGKHQLYGLLAAIQIGQHLGIDIEDSLKAITQVNPLPGRMVLHQGIDGCLLVDDSFAASYASTIAALEWLQNVKEDGQRTFLILGDIEGVGRNSRYAHRTIGQQAAEVADYIITQGVEAALAGRAAIDSGVEIARVFTTYSTQDVLGVIDSLDLTENDILLIKGGASAALEQVVESLLANEDDKVKLVRQDQVRQEQTPRLRPSWIEIDADALATNVQVIVDHIGDDVTLMAVVKADAYGHGAVLAARTAVTNGAGYLAVASIAEAIELRDAGITTPILVLSYTPAELARQAHQLNITVTIFDLEQAELYDRMARTVSGKLKVHIKIDSGMGRLGIFAEDAVRAFRLLNTLTNLEIEGIYTHFSSADDDPEVTQIELDTFKSGIRPLRAAGINVKYTHAANSPGTVSDPENHFNLVRPGLILYGLHPSEKVHAYDGVRPVMSWKTQILQVKDFPPGHPIGYNGTYTTRTNERIAILPVGYADGFRRAPYTWEYVLVHGKRAPIVGRVSMEKAAIKVDGIDNVRAGDEVVLLGKQGNEEITAEMIAEWLETSNYEVVTSILPRVPRR